MAVNVLYTVSGIAVIGALYSTLAPLYRAIRAEPTHHPLPIATLLIFAMTAVVTTAQFFNPAVLEALRRNLVALADGQWWRIATPLLVQSDGVGQAIFNLTTLLLVGPLVEWILGSPAVVLLYLVTGVLSEIPSYFWEPDGAGSSIAIAGWVSALFVLLVRGRNDVPPQARIVAGLGLLGAVGLTIVQDNHGPALLIGAGLTLIVLWFKHKGRA